jgi:fibrillarin-like pre-rRNA processing protein
VRRASELEGHPDNPRLRRRPEEGRYSLWTEALGPGSVYGERTLAREGGTYRRFEPARSKLSAALVRDDTLPVPRRGERWLYLGAATGTTASHLADLVNEEGAVYAVEKSLRPFARLLALAETYPNLRPILDDARAVVPYLGLVPPVDGMYVDVAQPDQVAIVLANAAEFLRAGGWLFLALKTSSMGRERSAEEHREAAAAALAPAFRLRPPVALDPFHRRHYMLVGKYRADPERPSPATRRFRSLVARRVG